MTENTTPPILRVKLHGEAIGTLTLLPGDQTLFTFDESYIEDPNRPTLSLSFKDQNGGLIWNIRPTRIKIPHFFSNLLPEGPMRDYLANRANVNAQREFFLLNILGRDLPGAITVEPVNKEAFTQDKTPPQQGEGPGNEHHGSIYRFSLAGVQLKFSALMEASGGLTIPAQGIGGAWIVKLPSMRFPGVPENEYMMMELARAIGMDVPEVRLIDMNDIIGLPGGIEQLEDKAFAIRRFDRSNEGPVHVEDFAQVFSVFPEQKYEKASHGNLAQVIWTEVGADGIAEFIRRIVFSILIGNADMHLKNWSMIYPDKRHARLAPAYDFVSTIAYIDDTKLALSLDRIKNMAGIDLDRLKRFSGKSKLPEKLVLRTARETIDLFMEEWPKAKENFENYSKWSEKIDQHLKTLALLKS